MSKILKVCSGLTVFAKLGEFSYVQAFKTNVTLEKNNEHFNIQAFEDLLAAHAQ